MMNWKALGLAAGLVVAAAPAMAACPSPFGVKDGTGSAQNTESINSTAGNCIFPSMQTDTAAQPLYTKSAFRYSTAALGNQAASPTDWVVIGGSATKTVRVTNITVCGTATAASTIDVVLIKRSSADTGGTPVSATAVPLDSNDAAATGTVVYYTANPTGLGTAVGNVDAVKLNLGASGAAGCGSVDFGTRNSQAVVLRGVAQQLAINLNGATVPSGASISYRCETTEE